MRDILKLHSGTPSGTGVSLQKMPNFEDFLVRGQISKHAEKQGFTHKKANCQLLISLTFYSIQFTTC